MSHRAALQKSVGIVSNTDIKNNPAHSVTQLVVYSHTNIHEQNWKHISVYPLDFTNIQLNLQLFFN